MSELTGRQQLFIKTVKRLAKTNKRWPTTREVMQAMGVSSPNGIAGHVTSLEKKGIVEPSKGRRRAGIRLVGPCPCCGKE